MALKDPRTVYGIHAVSPYRRSDKLFYGTLKVIGSASIALSSEQELLYAGSNKFPWAAESKTVSTEMTMKVKALPGFLFELFLGATVTDAGPDAGGAVSTIANAKGTSMVSATTGIASVAVIPTTGPANLKFGKYVVKATGAKAFDIFLSSDIDISRGTDAAYTDDSLKVGSVTLGDTSDTQDVADLGLKFTGGSGTVALVTGDTATFEVVPPSSESSTIVVGKSDAVMPAFGAIILAQKRATDEIFEIDAHNCVGSGMPLSFEENAWSQPEIKVTCLYDSSLDRVFTIRHAKMS